MMGDASPPGCAHTTRQTVKDSSETKMAEPRQTSASSLRPALRPPSLIRLFLTLCLTSGLTLRNPTLTVCRHLISYRQRFPLKVTSLAGRWE